MCIGRKVPTMHIYTYQLLYGTCSKNVNVLRPLYWYVYELTMAMATGVSRLELPMPYGVSGVTRT